MDVGGASDKTFEAALRTLRTFGSTGCLEVISTAVLQRAPTIIFPVANTNTLAPLAAAPAHASSSAVRIQLRDALLLKPLSTVGDVFEACKRLSPPLVAGDFVRAEARPAAAWTRSLVEDSATAAIAVGAASRPLPIRKDDVVSSACAILRIQSNRKSHWQQQA